MSFFYSFFFFLQFSWYEVQIQDGRPNKTRERKRRVLWTGKVTPPAVRHNESAGQSLHHKTMYQLSQNEDGVPRRWVQIASPPTPPPSLTPPPQHHHHHKTDTPCPGWLLTEYIRLELDSMLDTYQCDTLQP